MKCPHCMVAIHSGFSTYDIGEDKQAHWYIDVTPCPACSLFIIALRSVSTVLEDGPIKPMRRTVTKTVFVRPRAGERPPCPPEVPADLASDYHESCLVLSDSPKASAALSRRCLQHLLRNTAGVKHGSLADEISQVLQPGALPSHLAEAIDAIRNIGNFAAHPLKSSQTGEVLPVEPGEAEWNLDVLEGLFDFYFVQPTMLKKKRDALNDKLAEAGKQPMK